MGGLSSPSKRDPSFQQIQCIIQQIRPLYCQSVIGWKTIGIKDFNQKWNENPLGTKTIKTRAKNESETIELHVKRIRDNTVLASEIANFLDIKTSSQ